jgi:arylformamidase
MGQGECDGYSGTWVSSRNEERIVSSGTAVWLGLDQAALDAAYDQRAYAPNWQQVLDRIASNSALLRSYIGDPQILSYGDSPTDRLLYYSAGTPNAPIHIHIQGGGWRRTNAENVLFLAEAFLKAGIGFAVYDFISVEETDGDLEPVLAQVCRGLIWLAKHAGNLGANADRLYLSGCSSGAHLAAVAMTADWRSFGFAKNPYQGAVLVSGMYDLHPVRLSKRSQYVAFTDGIEERMSPQRHVESIELPIILAHGTLETPEFQRQTRDFAAALARAGKPVQHVLCRGYNHFEMLELLGNPCSVLGRAAIAQVTDVPAPSPRATPSVDGQ